MTLDLTPFRNRVHAAVTTNQCLDYAADVQVLIHEVERLQRGYDALEQYEERMHRRAAVGVGITFGEMRQAAQVRQGASGALMAFNLGAR